MKKTVLLLGIILCILSFIACSPTENGGLFVGVETDYPAAIMVEESEQSQKTEVQTQDVTAQAQVIDMENGLIVMGLDAHLQGLCTVDIGDIVLNEDITAGDIIAITWGGAIAESYPAQIGHVTNIELIEDRADLLGVYREAFMEVRTADPGLDGDAQHIAIDLTDAINLNYAEKDALIYLISTDIGTSANVYQSTFEELESEGLITSDGSFKQFDDGVLYTIEVMEFTGDEQMSDFTFNIMKWRSSLGAYGMDNCKARISGGVYEWDNGGIWIS